MFRSEARARARAGVSPRERRPGHLGTQGGRRVVDGSSVALAPPRRPTASAAARPRRSSARGDVERQTARALLQRRARSRSSRTRRVAERLPQGSPRRFVVAPRATLLLVPLLWATANPALRFIYESDAPPSPAELTAVRMLVSLVPFSFVLEDVARDEARKREAAAKETSLAGDETDPTSSSRDVSLLLRAGLELGLVNAAATAFQAYGLELTSATRAGFLLYDQRRRAPGAAARPARVQGPWIAVALAAVGVAVTEGAFTPDALDAAASVPATGASSLGDACCLAAAALYSAFTVRLGVHARRCDAAELSACKAAAMAAACVGWWVVESTGGSGASSADPAFCSIPRGGFRVVGARWYAGDRARALAGVIQTKRLPPYPTETQLVFATTPCSTALATAFLGSARRSDARGGG